MSTFTAYQTGKDPALCKQCRHKQELRLDEHLVDAALHCVMLAILAP